MGEWGEGGVLDMASIKPRYVDIHGSYEIINVQSFHFDDT